MTNQAQKANFQIVNSAHLNEVAKTVLELKPLLIDCHTIQKELEDLRSALTTWLPKKPAPQGATGNLFDDTLTIKKKSVEEAVHKLSKVTHSIVTLKSGLGNIKDDSQNHIR